VSKVQVIKARFSPDYRQFANRKLGLIGHLTW
jgi:hypothetical protein